MKTVVNIHDPGLGKTVLDLTLKVEVTTKKINFIKIESFHPANDTIKKVKRQHRACEKIFANQT